MHTTIPIRFINPGFRAPSEAQSLSLPVTKGCSWNRCTYCEMYTAPQKKFTLRDLVLQKINKGVLGAEKARLLQQVARAAGPGSPRQPCDSAQQCERQGMGCAPAF